VVVSQKQVNGKVRESKPQTPLSNVRCISIQMATLFAGNHLALRALYCRYPLSYRNLEEMRAEQGTIGGSFNHQQLGVEVRGCVGQTNPPSSETHQRYGRESMKPTSRSKDSGSTCTERWIQRATP
jgi:hypothetical protein